MFCPGSTSLPSGLDYYSWATTKGHDDRGDSINMRKHRQLSQIVSVCISPRDNSRQKFDADSDKELMPT